MQQPRGCGLSRGQVLVGKILLLLAVFAAGHFWGDVAFAAALEAWTDIMEK